MNILYLRKITLIMSKTDNYFNNSTTSCYIVRFCQNVHIICLPMSRLPLCIITDMWHICIENASTIFRHTIWPNNRSQPPNTSVSESLCTCRHTVNTVNLSHLKAPHQTDGRIAWFHINWEKQWLRRAERGVRLSYRRAEK